MEQSVATEEGNQAAGHDLSRWENLGTADSLMGAIL